MNSDNKCRVVYIRHGDKEYNNGDSPLYKHDPGLTETGVEKSKIVANYLVDKWGAPDIIYTSPYRRTRETSITMNSALTKPVEIISDVDLSEYLGNHNKIPLDVTRETLYYAPPHPETFSGMTTRVYSHYSRMSNLMRSRKFKLIWVVTHGLIIKQIGGFVGVKQFKKFPPLSCMSLSQDRDVKAEIIIF